MEMTQELYDNATPLARRVLDSMPTLEEKGFSFLGGRNSRIGPHEATTLRLGYRGNYLVRALEEVFGRNDHLANPAPKGRNHELTEYGCENSGHTTVVEIIEADAANAA